MDMPMTRFTIKIERFRSDTEIVAGQRGKDRGELRRDKA